MIYALEFGESEAFLVAERKDSSGDPVSIRCLRGERAVDQLRTLQRIHHCNITKIHEIYKFETEFYVVFEHMPLSLQEIVGNPYLNDVHLAAIMRQVSISESDVNLLVDNNRYFPHCYI